MKKVVTLQPFFELFVCILLKKGRDYYKPKSVIRTKYSKTISHDFLFLSSHISFWHLSAIRAVTMPALLPYV